MTTNTYASVARPDGTRGQRIVRRDIQTEDCDRCGRSAQLSWNDRYDGALCEPCDIAVDEGAPLQLEPDPVAATERLATAAPPLTDPAGAAEVVRHEIDLLEHVQKGNVRIAKIEVTRAGWRDGQRARSRKPRVYFTVQGSSVLGALALRGSEPHRAYRAFLPAVWALLVAGRAAGLTDPASPPRARWDRHAGCSMCPCSPGFTLDGGPAGTEVHVTLEVG